MMNKRIREFAEQCSTPGQFDVEKFANLVIKECVDECIGVSCSNLNIGKLRDEGISMCMDKIRMLRSDL